MKKPLKIAAWSGVAVILTSIILSIVLSIFPMIFSENVFLEKFFSFFNLIILVFSILFLYGFFLLGKKFNSKLLMVMSLIGIISGLVLYVTFFMINLTNPHLFLPESIMSLSEEKTLLEEYSEEEFDVIISEFTSWLIYFFIFLFLFLLFLGIYLILFGVGILKLGNKVRYSKPAGVLNIITGSCLIIPILGWIIASFTLIPKYILEIILLFSASNDFEK